jgi:hypothetical protein
MRSKRSVAEGQEALWDAPDAEPSAAASMARATRRPRTASAPREGWQPGDATLVLTDDTFARSGWPSGTVLHLVPASRADRGEFVVVREAGRTKVGRFGLDRGRPALLSDTGSSWLSDAARVVAAVSVVEAPLAL